MPVFDPGSLPVLKASALISSAPPLEPSGLADLDAAFGGVPAQGLIELLGNEGSGTLSLALALAHARSLARGGQGFVFADASADAVLPTGPWAERAIVVRPSAPREALAAFDEALRSPALCAAVVRVKRVALQKTQRLNHAARQGASLGILLRPAKDDRPTAAAVRLRVRRDPQDLNVLGVEVLRARGLPAEGKRFELELGELA